MKVTVTERSALVQIAQSTQRITAHAGLVLVRELADRLGVGELLGRVTVKKRRRGYSPAQVILALCETLIAGGECLDDVALLRADSAQELLRGHGLPESTTLGRFLRRFTLGHLGQLNRALDELFARVGPLVGRESVTLDLDASYVEHHGPVGSRQGTRGVYTGKVAWHPLLCFVGETGEWLHAKLRNGHAAASTGATRFLAECVRRVPAGVRLFLRADEGFYGKGFLAELERRRITYTIGAQLNRALRERIASVGEADWQRSSYRDGSEVTSFVWRPRSWKQATVRRPPRPGRGRRATRTRRGRVALLGARHQRQRTLPRRARELASRQSERREPNQGGQTRLRPRQPPLPELPRQLDLPALHPARLQPALLAETARAPRQRTRQLCETAALPFIAVAGTVGRSGRQLILRLSAGYALFADFLAALQRIRGLARAPA